MVFEVIIRVLLWRHFSPAYYKCPTVLMTSGRFGGTEGHSVEIESSTGPYPLRCYQDKMRSISRLNVGAAWPRVEGIYLEYEDSSVSEVFFGSSSRLNGICWYPVSTVRDPNQGRQFWSDDIGGTGLRRGSKSHCL